MMRGGTRATRRKVRKEQSRWRCAAREGNIKSIGGSILRELGARIAGTQGQTYVIFGSGRLPLPRAEIVWQARYPSIDPICTWAVRSGGIVGKQSISTPLPYISIPYALKYRSIWWADIRTSPVFVRDRQHHVINIMHLTAM